MEPLHCRGILNFSLVLLIIVIQLFSCKNNGADYDSMIPESISIYPSGSVYLEVGQYQTLTATCHDYNGLIMDSLNIQWRLHGDSIGVLNPNEGATVEFLATYPGEAYIISTCSEVSDSIFVVVSQAIVSFSIVPDSVIIESGNLAIFRATGTDINGHSVDLDNVYWEIIGDMVVEIRSMAGDSIIILGNKYGIANLLAVYGSFADTVFIKVLMAGPFSVLSDEAIAGYIGLFSGSNDIIEIVFDSTDATEGIWSLRMDYFVRNDGWAGCYVEEGDLGGHQTRDLSNFEASGHLRFDCKSVVDLEIAIRSDNIIPGEENSRIYLSEYGANFNGLWESISIPLRDFASLESSLDFRFMEVYFVASVVGYHIGETSYGYIWIDNIRWTKD